jgi:hypothetical protein
VFEIGITLALGLLLWAAYWAFVAAPDAVFLAGLWLIAAGFAFGVPTGFAYHVLLYRSLRRVDALHERWWLHPTSLHHAIPRADRLGVLAWCYAGALGLVVIVIGIPLCAAGAWRLGQV